MVNTGQQHLPSILKNKVNKQYGWGTATRRHNNNKGKVQEQQHTGILNNTPAANWHRTKCYNVKSTGNKNRNSNVWHRPANWHNGVGKGVNGMWGGGAGVCCGVV